MRVWLAFVLLVGCEGCGGEATQAASATPSTESSAAASTSGASAGDLANDSAPAVPEHVAVRTETDRYGRVSVAVENRGTEVARLAPRLAAGETTLPLRVDCEGDAPSCIELAPGAVLYPCDCASCESLTPSTAFELRGCP